ncbi:MAG: nitroreductase family protein [Proteobacteria bacterium]|nr:nitroreductase family protein [Pseudomonadota bacterium]
MEFSQAMEKRRAVNFFDPKRPVDPGLLKKVIETAALTPSSFNLQPWNVMVLTEPEEKKKLRALAWDQAKVEEAPVILVFLADRDGWKEGHATLERNYAEMLRAGSMTEEKRAWFLNACKSLYGGGAEMAQAFACKNTGFFAMSVMLAAADAGLDTHPMDGFDHDKVRQAFKIPENYWIPLLLAVGHFDKSKTLAPPKWRKSFEDIVVKF